MNLDALIKAKVEAEKARRKKERSLFDARKAYLGSLPRIEISHNLRQIRASAERARVRIDASGSEEQKEALAMIYAYLELASVEPNFANAWSLVNLADATLTLVVDERELKGVIQRLHGGDGRLSSPKFQMTEPLPKNYLFNNANRYDLYGRQMARAGMWNSINCKVTLKNRLWKSVGFWLFASLAAAITLAEILGPPEGLVIGELTIKYPFLAIAVIGFFGGAISAYRSVPQYVVETPSYQLVKLLTVLRMLLGAAGAFVVFVSVFWLASTELLAILNKNIFAFFGLGITAGFSERLFVDALNRMAENLSIGGSGPKTDSAKNPSTPAPSDRSVAGNVAVSPDDTASPYSKLSMDEQDVLIQRYISTNFAMLKQTYPGLTGINAERKKFDGKAVDMLCISFQVIKKDDTAKPQFPKTISFDGFDIPTDVHEADVTLPKALPVPLEGGVARSAGSAFGSIGIPVKDNNGKQLVMTCFHVVFDKELAMGTLSVTPGTTISAPHVIGNWGPTGPANNAMGSVFAGEITDWLDIAVFEPDPVNPLDKTFHQVPGPFGVRQLTRDDENKVYVQYWGFGSLGKRALKVENIFSNQWINYTIGGKTDPKFIMGLIQLDGVVPGGDSGAPVFDGAGNYVGSIIGSDNLKTYLISARSIAVKSNYTVNTYPL